LGQRIVKTQICHTSKIMYQALVTYTHFFHLKILKSWFSKSF
jgi:hypothetical protein